MAVSRRSRSSTSRVARPGGRVVHVGLTQMACGPDPKANLARQLALASRAAAKGAEIICTQELFRSPVLLPVGRPRLLRAGRTDPRADHRRLPEAGEAARRGRRRVAVREAGRRPVSQHRRHHRRRRIAAGHLPQDAHPRRPAVLREVLLHARRHRVPGLDDEEGHHRRADLLGPVVSRRRPAHRAARRGDPLLPHRHRLASRREGGVRPRPARRRGSSSSAATPWPTAARSACPTASATSWWPVPTAGR